MKLELRSIVQPGDREKERITLRALADTDIGDYLLAQAGYTKEGPSTELFHTLWFPYKDIGQGDLVVVYTRSGTATTKLLSTGKTAHFYYWGMSDPIWNHDDRAALLMHAPSWEAKPTDELKL